MLYRRILILLFLFLCNQWLSAASLKCVFLPQLLSLFLKTHYLYKKIDAKIAKQTIDQLITDLDPSKLTFYKDDVAKLNKILKDAFWNSLKSDCKLLAEVKKILFERTKENEELIRSILSPQYKFDETAEVVIDPKKRDYPKNKNEKKNTLLKMVHFQIQSYFISNTKLDEAKKKLIHRYELITKRIASWEEENLVESLASAFARALDPHTSYLSSDEMEDFNINMQLSLEGIGASLSSQDGFTVIEEILPGGGAEKVKVLRPKDKIIAVAQGEKGEPVNVVDMELKEVVKLIRGKKGTKVKLTILRQTEETKTFDVVITREKIDLKGKAAKMTYFDKKVADKKYKIGFLDIPSFYGGGKSGTRNVSEDVSKLLKEAKKRNVSGIILDLSRNGGGILEEAVKIAGFFINRGSVVATKGISELKVLEDTDSGLLFSGPLVVLISRISASGAEILAGALQDYRRALIVGGDHSFGKGSVQTFSALPLNMGAMKVTVGLFFLPQGKSTQLSGIKSDIELPSVLSVEEFGEKNLDYSLPEQKITPFLSNEKTIQNDNSKWKPIDNETIKKLKKLSEKRIKQNKKFAEILENIEKTKKNAGIIKLSELKKESLKDKGKEKDPEKEYMDSAHVEEGINILLDLISLNN